MIKALYKLFLSAVNPKDNYSSKRITLLLSLLYFFFFSTIMGSMVAIAFFVSGRNNPEFIPLINFLSQIMEYNFWIILASLGFITSVDLGYALVQRVKNTFIQDKHTGNEEFIQTTDNNSSDITTPQS